MSSSRAFFKKLKKLFHDHGATLYGCGCCGSPSISIDGETFECVFLAPGKPGKYYRKTDSTDSCGNQEVQFIDETF